MIRRAFTMRLKAGSEKEYIAHHDSVPTKWPDLVDEIKRSGIATITTFQNGLDLFLYSEIKDEQAWNKLWHSPTHVRWAELMKPLMHMNAEGIVEAGELKEIFHLDTDLAKSRT